jgi:ABC-type multidrug transport system ATPase subunit
MTTWGLFNVSVSYGPHRALQTFSIDLHPGAITAVVGGDGAGKTTALRTLVGVVAPHDGEVRRPKARSIGYVSAAPGIYPDLSVIENLEFAGTAYGLDRAELSERADALIERTDLGTARNRLAAHLSGGMRQKLALAAAMIHSPRLLVLDEPTTGVDPVSRSELWRLIARAASDGAAVFIATSYIDEAERAAEVAVLTNGVTIATGTAGEILSGTPGAVFIADQRPTSFPAWRRGPHWHVWARDGSEVPGAKRIAPDIEDAVIIAELSLRESEGRTELIAV